MAVLNGKLVTVNATDGLRLKGYLAIGQGNIATIIHVHGNFGNFYENEFIPIMAEKYTAAGINFLSVNNRGHDGIAEAYQNGKLIYTGGAIESPEQCQYDIGGAIQFVNKLNSRIILQGHSFGCLRVLSYLIQNPRIFEFILLSPADAYRLQAEFIFPEIISDQVARIKRDYIDRLDVLLPPNEFGIRKPGVEYFIPISARTFLSLFEGSMPAILRYDSPSSFFLKTNGFIYYGGKDGLWTKAKSDVLKFFSNHIENVHFCYRQDGDHHLHGIETSVVDEIIKWVCSGA